MCSDGIFIFAVTERKTSRNGMIPEPIRIQGNEGLVLSWNGRTPSRDARILKRPSQKEELNWWNPS